MFRFIDTSFVPEAYEQIGSGKITTLPELNQALMSWVEGYYHHRKHGSTGQTPLERASRTQRRIPRKTITELTEIFLWEDERTVDKTGCVSLTGNTYEVDLELVGQRVLLRYDPFDLTQIQIWWRQKRYADAILLDLKKPRHNRVKSVQTKVPESCLKTTENESNSFFELAEQRRRAEWVKEPLSYAPKKEDAHE